MGSLRREWVYFNAEWGLNSGVNEPTIITLISKAKKVSMNINSCGVQYE
jgi:hypothetical protein